MLSIVLGILAAAFYGAADFCGGIATKRTSIFAVTIVSQAAGLALLAIVVVFTPGRALPFDYLWGALGGICGGVGIALLYHALSIGKMGVVSPITAVLAAATPAVFGVVVRHEPLAWFQIAGILVALVAVVLISLSHEEDGRLEFSTAGVKEAIAAGLIIGGFFLFLGTASPGAGLQPLLIARVASVLFLLLIAAIARSSFVPRDGTLGLVVFAGGIDMTANVLFVLADHAGLLSVASVLTSLYPASTVLLARVVLKERLALIQKLGVGLALAGVALIAY
ncbi:MAG: DMT family transporter [Candidatus Eremiobacteraeota bacterium]|nr:DMT family transporter [Candidatus Eremiobacteraeota bacterium]